MFNSREYEYADITVIAGATDIIGLRAIEYKQSAEKEPLYAKGRKAKSIQTGNLAYDGTLTVTQSAAIALGKSHPKGLLGVQLDLGVNYGNPVDGDALTTDRLIALQFTEVPKGMKQGDKFMEVALPFIFLDLQENV